MKSRVTTAKGDQGTTRLLSGETVSKSHLILECTGAVDRLRAHLALLRLQVAASAHPEREQVVDFLYWLLHTTFLVGTEVNDPACVHPEYRKENIGPRHLARLEEEQGRLEAQLQLPKSFIVSASNPVAAQADITATVARDLERAVVRLKESEPRFRGEDLLPFLNRLSDFLFVLARFLEEGRHLPVDYSKT